MREGWEITKLGAISEIFRGGSPRPIKSFITQEADGVNWIKIGDTEVGGKYIYSTEEKIRREGMRSSRYVEPGDFLLSNSMSFGRPYILKTDGCIHDGWLVIKKYDRTLIQDFLYYLLLSPVVARQFEEGARGSTVRNLNTDIVSNVVVSYPVSHIEQQRIVDILDREFAKIDALKANAEKNLQAAKDLFRHISNGYYNEPSPVSKLGGECIFVRGPFGGSLKKSCFVPSGYPVYEQQHAIYSTFSFRYFVNEEKYKEMKRFTTHPGDLIMSCSGTIGKVAIIPENAPIGIINQALLKLTPKKRILPEYLKWYMQSISFEKDIQRHSKGAAIQNVASVAILKEITIPVPTIEKQRQIVARLDDLNERCNDLQENYQKTLTLCDDLKQALLRKAFNGEL